MTEKTEHDKFAMKYQGGAEIELSMLFADIRGSTTLAEGVRPTDCKRLIDRFYQVSTPKWKNESRT